MYNIVELIKDLNDKTILHKINWKHIANEETNLIDEIFYISKSGYKTNISLRDDYFMLAVDTFTFFFHDGDDGYDDISRIWNFVTSNKSINRALKYMMFGD